MGQGQGHPLPRSGEARHNEIPESLERRKGEGDDARRVVQPDGDPVAPDGESYPYGDLGRGPDDEAAHQERGQQFVDKADEEAQG